MSRNVNINGLSLFAGLMLCYSLPAEAQDVSQAELARCAAKPTAAEKLACYESLTVVPEPSAAGAAAASAAPVPDTRSTVPQDLGEEQLERQEESAEADAAAMTAVVREVSESRSGRLYFHFSNGQVWRQIEPRRFRYPKDREFAVTITQGMLGEYRLRVAGEGPMTRIRRVE